MLEGLVGVVVVVVVVVVVGGWFVGLVGGSWTGDGKTTRFVETEVGWRKPVGGC